MPTRVAAVLIHSAGKLLLTYNNKWRAFTFPMTKLPDWDFVDTAQIIDPDRRDISVGQLQEHWLDAAAHAVVECLGQPNCPRSRSSTPRLNGPAAMVPTAFTTTRSSPWKWCSRRRADISRSPG